MGIFVVGPVVGCLWSFIGVIGNMVCRLSVFGDWLGIVVVGRWGLIISGVVSVLDLRFHFVFSA